MQCCICHGEIEKERDTEGNVLYDQGHNPHPIKTEYGERCCWNCNDTIVLPTRMRRFLGTNAWEKKGDK